MALLSFTLRSQSLEGKIIDSLSQIPVPFAEIYILELDLHTNSDEEGVFSISTGTNYMCEPSVLRKGGAGFVVERAGKIVFPT